MVLGGIARRINFFVGAFFKYFVHGDVVSSDFVSMMKHGIQQRFLGILKPLICSVGDDSISSHQKMWVSSIQCQRNCRYELLDFSVFFWEGKKVAP